MFSFIIVCYKYSVVKKLLTEKEFCTDEFLVDRKTELSKLNGILCTISIARFRKIFLIAYSN